MSVKAAKALTTRRATSVEEVNLRAAIEAIIGELSTVADQLAKAINDLSGSLTGDLSELSRVFLAIRASIDTQSEIAQHTTQIFEETFRRISASIDVQSEIQQAAYPLLQQGLATLADATSAGFASVAKAITGDLCDVLREYTERTNDEIEARATNTRVSRINATLSEKIAAKVGQLEFDALAAECQIPVLDKLAREDAVAVSTTTGCCGRRVSPRRARFLAARRAFGASTSRSAE
jgi:hypothetical protein